MIKVSDQVRKLVQGNPWLQFGLSHRLFNLTQITSYLRPLLESQTKKELKDGAILMNLSRIQNNLSQQKKLISPIKVRGINIVSNLIIVSCHKNFSYHQKINNIYNQIQEQGSYINFTESSQEITIITEPEYLNLIKEALSEGIKDIQTGINGVIIKLSNEHMKQTGVLYSILQAITLQNINVSEICSTFTELVVYIKEKDTQLAFDTILHSFS